MQRGSVVREFMAIKDTCVRAASHRVHFVWQQRYDAGWALNMIEVSEYEFGAMQKALEGHMVGQ